VFNPDRKDHHWGKAEAEEAAKAYTKLMRDDRG
jgi:hypothetical protein